MQPKPMLFALLLLAVFILGCQYASNEDVKALSLRMNTTEVEIGNLKDIEINRLNKIKETLDSTVAILINEEFKGTGIIFDERGYIITASHVISNSPTEEISVCLAENQEDIKECYLIEETIIIPEVYDLTLLKIKSTKKFNTLQIADKGSVKTGSDIYYVAFQMAAIEEKKFLSVKLIGDGIISGYHPINYQGELKRLYFSRGVSWGGASGGPVFLKSGDGLIGFVTQTHATNSQLWLFSIVPIHKLKELSNTYLH